MRIGIPRETLPGETRVALVPSMVALLMKEGHEVLIESGAGLTASAPDGEYTKAGAQVVKDIKALFKKSDVICKVQPPGKRSGVPKHEAELLREGAAYIGFLAPLSNRPAIESFVKRSVTAFSLEYVPRITRAQGMDALSSMSTIAGYKAVLLAADRLGKMFPLLMTAAGTVPPAQVFVLGAGVAGLQAIATAHRLGAKVEAFDPRLSVKEQVKSLGAAFVEMEMPKDAETEGGYAKELSPEFLKKEQEAIATRLSKTDVIVSTAQVFGKKAPVLITATMVALMRPGSVIVDLAGEQGGNCELTVPGKTVVKGGVTIIGAVNLPASVPVHASQMLSRNIANLFLTIYPKNATAPNVDDEIVRGCCITRDGEVVNETVRTALRRKK